MRRILFLILSALLLLSLLSLTGCGEKENPIVGTWEAELDLTDELNAALSEDEALGEYMNLREFVIRVQTVYREDDTYSMSADRASIQTALDGLTEDLTTAVQSWLDASIAAYGGDMTAEEVLAQDGTSMDELITEMKTVLSPEELISGLNRQGRYRAEDGKLCLSDSVNTEIDSRQYEIYTIEGKGAEQTLTLTAGTEDDDAYGGLYPIVFHRMG